MQLKKSPSRCVFCGQNCHSAVSCGLRIASEAELRTEAARRASWKKLQEKYGPDWWKYTKGKI